MKKRHLKHMIDADMRQSTPNILNRIDLDAITIEEPMKKRHVFNRRLLPVLSFSTLAALIVLSIQLGLFTPGSPGPDPSPTPIAFTQKEQAYAVSAVSAISLLHQIDFLQNPDLHYLGVSPLSNTTPLLIDRYLDMLNRNLNMIEPIIGNQASMHFNLLPSTLEGYDYMMIFQSNTLTGHLVQYILHYNETALEPHIFSLAGIMVINNVTYTLEGELELDGDDYTFELLATHPSNEDTYVEIKQEVSRDKHTLDYEVVKNGDTLYESELSIQFDGAEITIEFEFESESEEVSFEIKRRQVNQYYTYFIEYEIELNNLGEEGTIVVDVIYHNTDQLFYHRFTITIDNATYIRQRRRLILTP